MQVLAKWAVTLYVVAIILQEARFGLGGFLFPRLTALAGEESFGLPFVGEYLLLGVVVLVLLDWIGAGTSEKGAARLNHSASGPTLRTYTTSGPPAGGLSPLGWLSLLSLWCGLVVIISALVGVQQASNAGGHARMLIEGVALFAAVGSMSWSGPHRSRVLTAFLVAGSVHGSIILLAFLAPATLPFQTNVIIGDSARYAGLFMQPSRAGLLFGVTLTIALGRLLFENVSVKARVVYFASAVLSVFSISLTQTRSILLAVGVVVVFLLWQLVRFRALRNRLLVAVAVICAVGAVAWTAGADIVSFGFDRFVDDSGSIDTGRGWIYSFVLDLISRYPLGLGVGGLEPASGDLYIPHAHNMYLHWTVMFGIPGLLLFLSLLAAIWRAGARLLAKVATRGYRWSDRLVLRALMVLFLVAFLSEPYLITNVGPWFWLVGGLLIAPDSPAAGPVLTTAER